MFPEETPTTAFETVVQENAVSSEISSVETNTSEVSASVPLPTIIQASDDQPCTVQEELHDQPMTDQPPISNQEVSDQTSTIQESQDQSSIIKEEQTTEAEPALVLAGEPQVPSSVDSSDSDSDSDSDLDLEELELQSALNELKYEPPKTANEITALPPVKKIEIVLTEANILHPLGVIDKIIDCLITVKSNKILQSDHPHEISDVEHLIRKSPPALAEGSVLCLADRTILGEIYETFGPVQQPFYTIRFNLPTDIPEGTTVGMTVCYPPEYATRVFPYQIYSKGCDASGEHDEEVPEEMMEFSDDEKEQQANQSKKKRKRSRRKENQAKRLCAEGHVVPPDFDYVPLQRPESAAPAPLQQNPVQPAVAPIPVSVPVEKEEPLPPVAPPAVVEPEPNQENVAASFGENQEECIGFFEPLEPISSNNNN